MMLGKNKAGYITRVGVLGAIAAVLYFFPEIPVIGFYKLDFSTLPALLAGFALGPVAGLIVVLIKDVIGMTHSTSMMVGELADFLCSGAFVVVSALIYKKHRNFKGALISMGVGIVVMTIIGALANYFIMIPFYINQMNFPEEAVIGMMAAVIPAVDSVFKLVLMVTAPFNVLKGVVLCVLTLLMYKRLSHLLHG
ncbi:MAG: ECF transporter S component [Clostridia bacterium]